MNHFRRNKFAWMLAAVAFPVATAALTGSANSACAPAAPVDNTTVTCTSATDNRNAPDGYGTGTENGLTINIESGASITGARFGVLVNGTNSSNTINNLGTISGIDRGISAGVAAINNSNRITSIAGSGIVGQTVTITNTESGTISARFGIAALTNGTVTNLGSITADFFGIEMSAGTIANSGVIRVLNGGGTAISGSNFVVTNSGVIQATGAAAAGIRSETSSDITVNNLASGRLIASRFGIDAVSANVTNAGEIESTAADGTGINAGAATVINSGKIVSTGASARAINTTGNADVTNNVNATISGGVAGIRAGGTATVANAQGALIETIETGLGAVAIAPLARRRFGIRG